MSTQIITDSSADLPKELIEKLKITIVPLCVHFGEERMPSDLSAKEFYTRMKASKNLPTTASPSPHTFLQTFIEASKVHDHIVVMCLSSNISSTYQNALVAKELFEEQGLPGKVEVIDTRSFSLGLGLQVVKAATHALAGITMHDLMDKVRDNVKEITAYFTLENLENVIKGGRLDRIRGTVASVLNIKLLLKISETGTVDVIEKVRGTQNALNRLIDKIGEKHHDFEKAIVGICHSSCEERALDVKRRILAKYPFKEVILSDMGPVIGSYAGEGGIGVAY